MKSKKNYAGIILAAGLSSRMGDFKAMMPLDGMPAIVNLIRNFRMAGVEDIYVVTGHRADLLEDVIEEERVQAVYNRFYEEGMFTSIQAGVAALKAGTDAFFLLPVDYSLIPAIAFIDMMEAFDTMTGCFLVPSYQGKKGHPPLFPVEMAPGILSFDGEGGLKAYTKKHESRMRLLGLPYEEVVMDMDTYEDYEEMAAHYERMQRPSDEACLALMDRYGTPERVREHSAAVTRLAVRLAEELNANGAALDVPLIRSAALLHDIVRDRKRHWAEGAAIARLHGFHKAAALIDGHMFHQRAHGDSTITELDILCLADKQFFSSRFVTLKERAMPILERFSGDPEALAHIRQRFRDASVLKAQIRRQTAKTVEDIWREALTDSTTPARRRLFLIRHGQTRRHREKIFLGQADVLLSSQGRLQSEACAEQLWAMQPNVTKIYCSDLARTVQTAEIIAKRLMKGRKQIIVPVREFREMALGAWDGLYISEIIEKYPLEYAQRGKNLLVFKIDNEAENYYDLRYRVMKKLNRLIETETDGDIVLVAHAGVIAVIRNTLEHVDLLEAVTKKQEYGSIHVIELNGKEQAL